MASKTPSNSGDEMDFQDNLSSFDRIEEALSRPQNAAVDPSTVFDHYDTVIAVYGSQGYEEHFANHVDVVSDAVPSRQAYNEPEYNDITDLNEAAQGDTLLLAVDLDTSPDYGEGVPTYSEITNENLNTEGKWWDHPEQVNADLLMDRTSFYGAVDTPGRAEVFEMSAGNPTESFYLFDNQD